MTREEILALPAGCELDAAVARSLGCKPEKWDDGLYHCTCPQVNGDWPHGTWDQGCEFSELPRYSRDMDAAESVILHLCRSEDGAQVSAHLERRDWIAFCRFEEVDDDDRHSTRDIHGETLALAVCRAALVYHWRAK